MSRDHQEEHDEHEHDNGREMTLTERHEQENHNNMYEKSIEEDFIQRNICLRYYEIMQRNVCTIVHSIAIEISAYIIAPHLVHQNYSI